MDAKDYYSKCQDCNVVYRIDESINKLEETCDECFEEWVQKQKDEVERAYWEMKNSKF